jgi:hypothetical protein
VLSAVTSLGGLVGAAAPQLCLFGNASVALVLVLVAAGLLAAYVKGAPILGPEEHRWIAACRDGLAVVSEYGQPPTLRWVTSLGRRQTPSV